MSNIFILELSKDVLLLMLFHQAIKAPTVSLSGRQNKRRKIELDDDKLSKKEERETFIVCAEVLIQN